MPRKRISSKVYSTDKFKAKTVSFKPSKDALCPEHEPLSQTIGVIKTIREIKARRSAEVVLHVFEEICNDPSIKYILD